MNTPHIVSTLLLRELRAFQQEILLFPDDDSLWKTLPGITNSAGNLALHVAGNLRQFVGAAIGRIPYVRNREEEFGRKTGTRSDIAGALEAAAAAVDKSLAGGALEDEFPERPGGYRVRTDVFLMHLCAHTAYHLGQAGYLRRALTGDSQTGGALLLKDIATV
jgi:uncharacterized damage-inducible protein DinB